MKRTTDSSSNKQAAKPLSGIACKSLIAILLVAAALGADSSARAEPVVLFSDDFSVSGPNGAPDPSKWGAPQSQHNPQRRIHVVSEGVAEKFGIEAGNALRFYKNEQTIASGNTSVTASEAFSHGSPVVTVAFEFWQSSGFPSGTINFRIGSGNIGNDYRTQDVQFRNGNLSNLSGIYGVDQPVRIELVFNNTALPITYAGGRATVAPDSFDAWINGVPLVSSRQQNRGGLPVGAPLTGLQFASFGSNRGEMFIRNLVVYEGAHVEMQEKQPPVELYMAVDGSDANDGLSLDSPVRTIAGVQTLLRTQYPQRDARIRIAPGRYHEQKVTWTYVPVDARIVFEALDPDLPRPVFDGCSENGNCNGGTWFGLSFSGGRPSNLEFRNLRIENYQTAISFNGNRNSDDLYNGGNVIEGCHFERIGNVFNPELGTSTAVIRLVNSKDNIIENNDFVDAINVTSGALLHAVYVAHLSDRNFILQNRFINHSGDPVRVRDYSNDNVIIDNIYIRAGAAGYSEWYCDQDARTDCTKPTPECPSWGNEFRNNFLVSGYNGRSLPTFVYHQPDSTTGCSPPSPDARRLRTSGNINSTAQDLDLWLHRYFAPDERDNPEISGDFATPAGDGIPNLLKYALGLDPKRRIFGKTVSRLEIDAGAPRFSYWRSTVPEDVQLWLEASDDLKNWLSVHPGLPVGDPIDDRVKMRTNPMVGTDSRSFFRIRVQRIN